MPESPQTTIAVLGATGYVGGRLIPQLLKAGYRVRALGRSLKKLKSRPWATDPNIELMAADVSDLDSLKQGLSGIDTAYYLVHSMNPGQKDFAKADRQAAENLVTAAQSAGLHRIIHLSGLGEDTGDLSPHLRSRAEVADILRKGPVPATILRAAMIIGSGSASFEILRYLVDRLPLMITPRWVSTPNQPISIRNVLTYLIGCLEKPETAGRTFDIGGPDVLSYRNLMEIYAEEARLDKRWIIPVPVFTPKLSSYWIHLITPVPTSLARPLAEGLKNPAVCQERSIQAIIPQTLLSCRESIHLALDRLKHHQVETHWTDAGLLPPVETVYPGDPNWAGGSVYKDQREITIQAPSPEVWSQVVQIGGSNGWYYGNWLWRIRGAMDQLIGGVGYRRGRRDPQRLGFGDAVDVWRVLEIEPDKYLKLLAEMKMPGKAILSFELKAQDDGSTTLVQTAWYVSKGLLGILYWYGVMPFHHFIFNGMLRGIANAVGKPILSGPVATQPSTEAVTKPIQDKLASMSPS